MKNFIEPGYHYQAIKGSKFAIHPDRNEKKEYDIALILLSSPFKLNSKLNTVPIDPSYCHIG
jgi:hypothetical protein